jgi:hypothetical protein
MDQKKKIHFYNSFQQYRATLGVLETSNLQILVEYPLVFAPTCTKQQTKESKDGQKHFKSVFGY